MFKLRLAITSLCVAMILTAVPVLRAEKGKDAPDAPIPTQILTAKKVFISNAGGVIEVRDLSGGPSRLYNEFYADIKAWGHHQLVGSPSEADLVLQINHYHTFGAQGGHLSEIKLELRDPKTNILLWTFDENIDIRGFGSRDSIDKGIDEAMDKIVGDLKALTAPPASAAK